MQLKKCGGCARAIVESAAVCQYCGHATDGFASAEPASRPQALEEDPFAFLDEGPLQSTPTESSLDDETPAEEAVAPLKRPAPDTNRDTEQRPQIVALDDELSSFDELWDTNGPAPAPLDADEQPQAAVASAAPVAAPAAAATPPKRGQAQMVAMGLAAGVVLIIAALGVRGTASPTAATTPVPAPAKKPAKTPAVVTPQPGAVAATAPVAVASGQTWSRVTDGRWVGRERRSVALELNANQKVAIWMRQVRPVLVVRCLANSADVFVFTQTAAKMEPQDENHTVQVGLDNAQPSTERWADSEEHDALFAPNGNAFAQQLLQSTTLRFGFTPHNASPVVAEFNVSGLAELLAPSARQCGFAPAAKATRKP